MSEGKDDEPEAEIPGLDEETIYDTTPEPAPEPAAVPPAPEPWPVAAAPKKRLPIFKWLGMAVGGFLIFSILSVAVHRFVPVPITILMIERLAQGNGIDHRWVSGDKISDNLKAAVIAAEDAKFCKHDGFDVEAIQKAEKYNATHKKKRGASTISQQTAKNVFLWPDRSWVRKGFEVYYTFLIEHMWPKDRIMTVYLNSVEWGPGIYGAEAASQHWFHHSAATLSKAEAAKLAAILPSPLKWKAAGSGKYVVKRSGKIQAARMIDNSGFDVCAVD
jgi:monofunctional biosynthetic peptidoglycan transglycosylase